MRKSDTQLTPIYFEDNLAVTITGKQINVTGTLNIQGGSEIIINDNQLDVDFRIEGDNQASLFFVDAGNDRIGIYTNVPTATVHLNETYTDATTHSALIVAQTWSPSTTSGSVFPAVLTLLPTYSTTHTPSGGFLSCFRLFGNFGNSGTLNYRGIDLRFSNNSSGTIALASDIHIRAAVNDGGGVVTDYRAINIENQTVAGTNYGIFQTGAAMLNRLGGKLTVGGTTNPVAQLRVDQSSTTAAISAMHLNQADVSEQFFDFNTTIGTGNAIEAVGAKTLTTTHFVKVTIPGGLTRYFPVGTIA